MVNSMEEAKVRTFIIDGVEIQTTLTAIEIVNLPKRVSELEKENFDLREGIMLEKMAIPKDKADIRNFYEIFEVPSYNQLEQALLDIKEYVEYYTNEYPGCKAADFDIMANPHCILDIINKVIKKDK